MVLQAAAAAYIAKEFKSYQILGNQISDAE